MEESVLLGTKPLVDSIRHFIRDPGGAYFPYVTFVSVVSFNDVTIPAFCFMFIFSLHISNKKNITRCNITRYNILNILSLTCTQMPFLINGSLRARTPTPPVQVV